MTLAKLPIFLALLACISPARQFRAQTWQSLMDFPGEARDDGTAFVIGNSAYAGTGVTSAFNTTGDFYRFDFETEVWSPVAPLPAGEDRQYAVGFAHGGFGYIFGGFRNGEFLNDLWRFDPAENTWEELSPLPGAPRSGAACFTLGSEAFIIGGKNTETQALSEVWVYNAVLGVWSQKNDLPFTSWRASTAVIDAEAYLIFGLDAAEFYTDQLWQYQPDSDSWLASGNFSPGARNYAAAYSTASGLVIFGGFDQEMNFFNDCWLKPWDSDAWNEQTTLPDLGRRGGISFQNGDKLYYTTGLLPGAERTRQTWKYTIISNTLTHEHNPKLTIYPNPAGERLKIQWPDEVRIDELYLRDGLGRLLKHQVQTNEAWLDVSDLHPGVYILQISSNFGMSTCKFVKN